MRDDDGIVLALLLAFVPFSLVSVGGAQSAVAGIQHQVVTVQHWMSAADFSEIFAVARIAPGPGSMLVTLIGWKLGGWLGAIATTAAFFVPSSLLCLAVVRLTSAYQDRRWLKIVQSALAPVGAGLILAAAVSVLRVSGGGLAAWIAAPLIAAAALLRPSLHPLLLMAFAGIAFALLDAAGGPGLGG